MGYQCVESDDAFRNSSKTLVKLVSFCDWFLAQGHASCSSMDCAYDSTAHCILLVSAVRNQYWKVQYRKVLCLCLTQTKSQHTSVCSTPTFGLASIFNTDIHGLDRFNYCRTWGPTFYMPVTDMITCHMEKGPQICNFNKLLSLQITALHWQMSMRMLKMCCRIISVATVPLSAWLDLFYFSLFIWKMVLYFWIKFNI